MHALPALPCSLPLSSPVLPPRFPVISVAPQKYRLYLRRLGGLSDKDRADADALQRLHEVGGSRRQLAFGSGWLQDGAGWEVVLAQGEKGMAGKTACTLLQRTEPFPPPSLPCSALQQNVQQMAAQQVLQHSLAAMQGPHPSVLAAMGIGMGGPAAPATGYALLPLPPHAAAAAAAGQAALAAAAAPGGASGPAGGPLAGLAAPATASPPGIALPSAAALPGAVQQPGAAPAAGQPEPVQQQQRQQQQQQQQQQPGQPDEPGGASSSLAALAEAALAEAAQGSGSGNAAAAAAGGASGAAAAVSGPSDRPQLTVSTSSGPAAAAAPPAAAADAPTTPTERL